MAKYSKEFEKYKRNIYPQLKAKIKAGKNEFDKTLSSLLDFYLHMLYFLDNQNKFFTLPPIHSLNTLYTKTACDIYGLYQCCSTGQIVPAIYIQRGIFETFVTVKLLTEKDIEYRNKLFVDYVHVLRYNHYKEYSNYLYKSAYKLSVDSTLKEEIESRLHNIFPDSESIQTNYDSVKNNYDLKYPFHWAYSIYKNKLGKKRLTLKYICLELGLLDEYFDIYDTSSLAVHNAPLVINLMQTEGVSTPSPIFSDKVNYICRISLNLAVELVLNIFEAIHSPQFEELHTYLMSFYERNYA